MSNLHIIRDFPFDINKRSVLRHQGYKPSSRVSDRVRVMLEEAIRKAKELAQPAGMWKEEEIRDGGSSDLVVLADGLQIKSKLVKKVMRGCSRAAIFAVTIGSQLEVEVAKLMKAGDMAEAVMLDSVGGESAEGCAEYLNKLVQKEAHRRGLHLTMRFSPGYGDWLLEGQRWLFKALTPEKIGITLTESCLMIPRKSITGIIGLGPLDEIRTAASLCKKCKGG